jgi:16S rRNA processing protein RimM
VARLKRPASSPRPSNPPQLSGARAFAGDAARLVVMGRIAGSFGVKGWVKVKPFSEAPEALGGFERWVVDRDGTWYEMPLEDFELHAKGPVAKLAGCDDRGAAEQLAGAEVAVEREELGEAEEGALYQVDLVGLEVVEESGVALGRVESFFEAGDASVMVVQGERERLIPFVDAFVKSVERESGRIVVDWKPEYDA